MILTYVCTNYNNSALTVAAVDSLMKCRGHDIRVFVVDNASRKEELSLLVDSFKNNPAVRVIESTDNVGYFSGLNIGIKAARLFDPFNLWMVVGNNDLIFPYDFCDCVESEINQIRKYSVVSPDIVTEDGQHQNPHVISNISVVREIFYDIYFSNYWFGTLIHKLAKLFPSLTRRGDEDNWRVAQCIYQGHGACYLLTPEFFLHFEELWSPTFMMSEELFLSLQLKKINHQVFYNPKIRVKHLWHGALQALPSKGRWQMGKDAHREYRKHVSVFKGFND